LLSVTIDTVAPQLLNPATFEYETQQGIRYTFSESVGVSLSPTDVAVQNQTTSTTVPPGSAQLDYNVGTQSAFLSFPGFNFGILPDGWYRATLAASGVTDIAGNSLSTSSVLDFFTLQGDANRDGRINTFDFTALAGNFNRTGMTSSTGDFNYDGKVNALDFN